MPIAGTVALPLVRGAAAFAAGDYAAALAHIEPVDGEIHRMGGSHAQWEIFEETMVVCHLKLEPRRRRDDAPPPPPRSAARPRRDQHGSTRPDRSPAARRAGTPHERTRRQTWAT